ncbi:hypothetical protein [Anaerosporobacter sp.]|uniref:hypothetical protein n=1 Tax=Anaerosporobacter sp. TaxID=1872529 RepID=UPI00286F1478|nr:hypothetical protein [Anaerosporobacter sp.]
MIVNVHYQKHSCYLGFDYFMNHIDVSHVYAMHCWNDFSVIPKLKAMDCSKTYRNKINIKSATQNNSAWHSLC